MTTDRHPAPRLNGARIRELFSELDERLEADNSMASLYVFGPARETLTDASAPAVERLDVEIRAGLMATQHLADVMACEQDGPPVGWLDTAVSDENGMESIPEDMRKATAWSGKALVVHTASPERSFALAATENYGFSVHDLRDLCDELDIESVDDATHAYRAFSVDPHTPELPAKAASALGAYLPQNSMRDIPWKPRPVSASIRATEIALSQAVNDLLDDYPNDVDSQIKSFQRNQRVITDPMNTGYGTVVPNRDPDDPDEVPYHVYGHLETETDRESAIADYITENEWGPAGDHNVDAYDAARADYEAESPTQGRSEPDSVSPESPGHEAGTDPTDEPSSPEIVERPSAKHRLAAAAAAARTADVPANRTNPEQSATR